MHTAAFLLFAMPSLMLFCSRKPAVPPDHIVKKYLQDADRFCHAVTDCLIEETQKNLEHDPQAARFITDRMNRELCLKNQYLLIGRMSTDPFGKEPVLDDRIYKAYSECSQIIAGQKTCALTLKEFRENPSCLEIKSFQP